MHLRFTIRDLKSLTTKESQFRQIATENSLGGPVQVRVNLIVGPDVGLLKDAKTHPIEYHKLVDFCGGADGIRTHETLPGLLP